MTVSPKKRATQFRKKFGITLVTEESLSDALEALGYTVIPFGASYNDEDTSNLIRLLGLSQYVKSTRGFTYASEKYRLVFVNSSLSDDEKLIVLSHEAGHIFCEHFSKSPIMGSDVTEENEANEFSHFLLHPPLRLRFCSAVKRHKILTAVICTVVIAAGVAGIVMLAVPEKSGFGEYYVTATGSKYHRKNCMYVKDKESARLMTEEEYESGEYAPCKVCLPDETDNN